MIIDWRSGTYLQRQAMRPSWPIVARFVGAAGAIVETGPPYRTFEARPQGTVFEARPQGTVFEARN